MNLLPLKKYFMYLSLLAFAAFIYGCYSGKPVTHTFDGRVTKVHDGDSIHLTPSGEKRVIIRLAAIDAPEIDQAGGVRSRDHLRQLIMRQQVSASCNKLDKYKRQVCVITHNNEDVNLTMLKSGNAWYYERFREEQSRTDQNSYSKAAESARKNRLGLWQNPGAIPPWEFRALK